MTVSFVMLIASAAFCGVVGTVLAITTNQKSDADRSKPQDYSIVPFQVQRIQITVRIVDTRIVSVNTPDNPGAAYSYSAAYQNRYFMTFEAQDGTLAEMEIPEPVFCGNLAGFVGRLSYESDGEHLRFIDFERDMRYRVNGR